MGCEARPDGPARVLLAVIARHPKAVEDALRKGDEARIKEHIRKGGYFEPTPQYDER